MKWHHGHNNSIVNGIPRIGFMKGGEAARWSDIDMADHYVLNHVILYFRNALPNRIKDEENTAHYTAFPAGLFL